MKIKVRVGAFARVYRQSAAQLVTDMFSEKYESNAESAPAEVISGTFPAEFSENIRERIEFTDSGTEIIDCWTETLPGPRLDSEGKICFGVKICVFAKNAQAVSVVGDFNGWDVNAHVMERNFILRKSGGERGAFSGRKMPKGFL